MSNSNNSSTLSLSEAYITKLKVNVDSAKRCYDQASQAAAKAKSEYKIASSWKNLLKNYRDRILDTLDMANDLHQSITQAKDQAEKVCNSMNLTLDAVKILVDVAKTSSECNEVLRCKVVMLLDDIDKKTELESGSNLVQCLNELKTKVDEAVAAQLASIKEVLHVLKLTYELKYYICDGDDEGEPGLVYSFNQMKELMESGEKCPPQGETGSDMDDIPAECNGKKMDEPQCSYESKPGLEVADESGSSNAYKVKTEEFYSDAVKLEDFKKCVWTEEEKKRNRALSQYNALNDALMAAKEAKAC